VAQTFSNFLALIGQIRNDVVLCLNKIENAQEVRGNPRKLGFAWPGELALLNKFHFQFWFLNLNQK
jgi:hypothetical protein